jgi:hypothetical protein
MASLGSLVVDLQVQSAQLKKGLDDANKKLDDFGKSSDRIGKVLSTAFNLTVFKQVGEKLAGFVQHGAQVADSMGKMAQSTGTSVEEFSRLAYAAELSDVSAEELSASMGKLNKKISEAASGNRDAGAVFKALGISVKDASGHMRSSDEVMGDVAEKFAGLQDGAGKSALAMEIFGKSGANLIPMLNGGKAALAAAGAEADKFGVTVTKQGAESAERFNDAITRMKKAGEAVAIQLAAALTPALADLGDELLESGDQAGGLRETMYEIALGSVEVVSGFRRMIVHIAGFRNAVANIGESWAVQQEGAAAYQEELDKVQKSHDAMVAKIEASRAPAELELFPLVLDKAVKRTTDNIVANMARVKKAVKEAAAEIDNPAFETTGGVSFTSGGEGGGSSVYDDALKEHAKVVEQSAKDTQAAFDLLGQSTMQAADGLANMVMSRTGAAGSLIQSGMQGMAMGGPIGAAVGVGLDLLTRSKSFERLMGALDGIIQNLADGLGMLIEPVMMIIEPLAPLGAVFGVWAKVISTALAPGMALMSLALKVIVTPLLALSALLGGFWNMVVEFVQNLLRTLGEIPFMGFLKDWADDLDNSKVNTQEIWQSIDDLWNERAEEVIDAAIPPPGSAVGGGSPERVATSLERLGDSADKVTEQITNMISGYKLAATRYDSTVGDYLSGVGGPPNVSVFVGGQEVEPERVSVNGGNRAPEPMLIASYG